MLKKMINQVIFAVGTGEQRAILKGVSFKVEDGRLIMTALDGFKLAYRMSSAKCVDVMEVALTDATDGLCRFLHIHIKHLAVEVFNLQVVLYLGIVRFGILAHENQTVVDIIKQDFRRCSRSAEEIDGTP